MANRISWNRYFMEMAHLVSKRSTCIRRQHGSVLVRDNRILTTGYNGSVAGARHCTNSGCVREELNIPSGERYELCVAIHSEQNAIISAARNGVAIDGVELYCTGFPCVICARMIVNAGITTVYYGGVSPTIYKESKEVLDACEIEYININLDGE